ncbi:ribose 5-phosphate isomerase B [Pontibacter beigongshangensis]|uniref:ribose 5-phosphate isomerase B n=1 Tax=Pontibacter beigongshangensis TaxID=2574733 RepID=UPI00164F01CB|nr:ribose 5-phosphate isomerase B [Pontibacter beigongshangensis]
MAYKIAIGGDHAGFAYKGMLTKVLEADGHELKDFGPYTGESSDYPDFVHPLSKAVANQEFDYGILVCGSGNGVAITANKYPEIRAALCWKPELAQLARGHNNANVLCIPSRFVSEEEAVEMMRVFLSTDFEGGRHQTRVNKITNC